MQNSRALTLLAALGLAYGPAAAQVQDVTSIGHGQGGLGPVLADQEAFGSSVVGLGDLDGDGIGDMAVGSPGENLVRILFLNANGTVKSVQPLGAGIGGLIVNLPSGIGFGASLARADDYDGNGIGDLLVGAPWNAGNSGRAYLIHLQADGTAAGHVTFTSGAGGFVGDLSGDQFGSDVISLGDVDGDGISDLAVGAPFDHISIIEGSVWILFLNADGTVSSNVKIRDLPPQFYATWGRSLAPLGDVDGDGVPDMAVGSVGGGHYGNHHFVDVVFLNNDGSIKSVVQHSSPSAPDSSYSWAIDALGDVDGDGVGDLLVSDPAPEACLFCSPDGAVYIAHMNADGTLKSRTELSEDSGALPTNIAWEHFFGGAVASLGDIDGDGRAEIAVGSPNSPGGGTNRGQVFVLRDCESVVASSSVRNGSGSNPLGFAEVSPAIMNTAWTTTVDVSAPGTIGSTVSVGSGPLAGFFLTGPITGELLILPPILFVDVQLGADHAIPIPVDCSLAGATLSAQALRIDSGPPLGFVANNAIDFTIGTE